MEQPLYNKIGQDYNYARKADAQISAKLSAWLSEKKGAPVLDIGCGSGNYSLALQNLGFNVYGVDPSDTTLTLARERSENIVWTKGSAEKIPFRDNTFSGIFGTLTLHHWKNYAHAFKELYRVARTGARVIFFTATPEQMKTYWLNYYFPEMLKVSSIQMPTLQTIENAASEAGFAFHSTEPYFVTNALEDYFLYAGKNRPEIYFNDSIRRGISSFAALANAEEVKQGLKKLRNDIDSGHFNLIKKQFEADLGDYLFIKWIKT